MTFCAYSYINTIVWTVCNIVLFVQICLGMLWPGKWLYLKKDWIHKKQQCLYSSINSHCVMVMLYDLLVRIVKKSMVIRDYFIQMFHKKHTKDLMQKWPYMPCSQTIELLLSKCNVWPCISSIQHFWLLQHTLHNCVSSIMQYK